MILLRIRRPDYEDDHTVVTIEGSLEEDLGNILSAACLRLAFEVEDADEDEILSFGADDASA